MESLPISVVVLTKNEEVTISSCVNSIKKSKPAEIIIIDGVSTDGTLDIARRFTDRIYSDAGKGTSYARQLGADMATQEYVAYVDADVILPDGALATMLAELQDSGCVCISARVSPDTDCSNYWQRAQLQHYLFPHRPRHIGMLTCIFKREIILKYRFDSTAINLDDFDIEFKLTKDGHKYCTSSITVGHRWKANLKSFIAHRFLLGRIKPRGIRIYGPWHAEFWPPLVILYWLGFCLIKGKLSLIPYFVVDGVVETVGMVKGFFELLGEILHSGQKNDF